MKHSSVRFAKNVWLTHHAQEAMTKRGLDEETVFDVIEIGNILERGSGHAWLHKHVEGRQDNQVCLAVVIDKAVIVKIVMVDWQILEETQ